MADAGSPRRLRRRTIAATPFGPVVVVWVLREDGPKVVRVLLSRPSTRADEQAASLYPEASASSCAEIETLAGALAGSLEGEAVDVALAVAELDACPAFQRSVLRAEHGIPCGSVSTYRLLAVHLHRPTAARAVGNALATNPFPLIVPCHRAIRSDGYLGGYQGGCEMKRALLAMEGTRIDGKGRVIGAVLHYATSQAARPPRARLLRIPYTGGRPATARGPRRRQRPRGDE
jgi:methylated-DNA-[protein]-cysteine S-methyltransferase